jgi:hypothetical protein
MKKITIALIYAMIFLTASFTNVDSVYTSNLDSSRETLEIKEEVNTIEEENILEEEEEEQVVSDNQPEEIQTGSPEVAETYVEEEYVEPYVQPTETYGTYGRLYVSWYDVALYDYNVYTDSSLSLQEIVDNYDSAAYYTHKGRYVIADHNYQGFNVLNNLSEGTTSYIKFEDGSTIGYRLIQRTTGYNTGPDLVDTEENSFFDMDSDLIMYTCYGDQIMVTLWRLM